VLLLLLLLLLLPPPLPPPPPPPPPPLLLLLLPPPLLLAEADIYALPGYFVLFAASYLPPRAVYGTAVLLQVNSAASPTGSVTTSRSEVGARI
jgi:hypothetical protein